MTDATPEQILARAQLPPINGRPVRKDEIELHERGLYIESWLPERRSRRKPLLFVHGELAGSWLWERFLGYFAGRGWEGHALNLRNHFWSQTADPLELSFDWYVDDVVAAMERLGPNTVAVGHGMGGLLAMKAAERAPISALILLSSELPAELRPAAPMAGHLLAPEIAWYHSGRSATGQAPLPHSSRGLGRRPLKAEITGSNPVCGTNFHTTTCCVSRATRATTCCGFLPRDGSQHRPPGPESPFVG